MTSIYCFTSNPHPVPVVAQVAAPQRQNPIRNWVRANAVGSALGAVLAVALGGPVPILGVAAAMALAHSTGSAATNKTPVSKAKKQKKKTGQSHPKAQQPTQPDDIYTDIKPYADRPDVMAQMADLAVKNKLDSAWVTQVVGQARQLPQVARFILPPAVGVPKNWQLYRQRFVEPIRINAGVMFWQTHAKTLARAEKEFGVPASVIVAIIGVETLYGRNTGNFRVLDALATLAFDFPTEHPKALARQAFFRDELEQFLVISNRNGQNPLRTKGSYAGAMGLPQFMPSSIARYAIDYDGDGKIDLHNSADDAIGSVANYFKAFGWQTGGPTHFAVQFSPQQLDLPALLAPDILPTFDAKTLMAKGAILQPSDAQYPGKLALVELQNGTDAPSYVAGTENFYAITRYNWSSYYAMAVIELAQAVSQANR